MNTHTITVTTEQALAIAEALELAQSLCHRADSLEAFARYSGMEEILPKEITGRKYSEAYHIAASAIRPKA